MKPLIIATFIIIPAAWLLFNKFSNTPKTATTQTHENRNRTPTLKPGRELKDLTRDELSELVEPFKSEHGSRFAEIEALVEEGETVVTRGYQSDTGVCWFSTLTPTFATSASGKPEFRVAVKRFKFAIDGDYSTEFDRAVPVRPGAKSGIGVVADITYQIDLRAEKDPATGKIRLRATEYEADERRKP